METITFTTYRDAYSFLLLARDYHFEATHRNKSVIVKSSAPAEVAALYDLWESAFTGSRA